ncbi:MAG: ABC transporter permease subunit, partial [Acidimicrobiales bacterium]
MVVTFSFVEGAYISEILRGGRRAVDVGQTDAASALGMNVYRAARYVVAPQMSRIILPPMTSQFTQLVRDSSLGFFIGYQELVTRAREGVRLTSNPTPYMAAVIVYAVLLIVLQMTSSWLERREYSAR